MAEIGLAAAIIAVIRVTVDVGQQIYSYGTSVKNAKEDIAKIQTKLGDVGNILQKLKNVVERAEKEGKSLDAWPTLVSLKNPDGALEKCKLAILSLQKELQPVEGTRKKILELALWPSKKKKVEQCILDIEAQKQILIASLDIEHMDQSLGTGNVVTQISQLQIENSRREIIKWLSHTDPDSNQTVAEKLHSDGTGKWFADSEEYGKWKKEPNSFIWLHGIAGCGKTILCSEIINKTRTYCEEKPSDRVIAYFYFSFRDVEKQKVVNLLRSILSQLVRYTEHIPGPVQTLYEDYHHCQPASDRLLAAIHSMIDNSKEIFVIVDALDECPKLNNEREELCHVLRDMKDWGASKLHILVTSRKEADVTETLNGLSTIHPVSIQGAAVAADIEKFVDDELSQNPKLKKWMGRPDIQAEIRAALVDGAQGMFRWVYCQVESLRLCVSPNDVRKALKSLPKTLDDTYDRMLMNIPEEHRQRAFVALQWINYADEPVSIEELAEAVLIDPTADPIFDPDNRAPDSHWIIEMLSSLIFASDKARRGWEDTPIKVLEIAHFSVKEYLESTRILCRPSQVFHISEPSGIEDIIKRLILYIRYYTQTSSKTSSPQDLDQFPLLRYASELWGRHARRIDESISAELKELITNFFNSEPLLSSWLSVYKPDLDSKAPFTADQYEIASQLYYAALLGLSSVVQQIINENSNVNTRGGRYFTPLQAAVSDWNYNENVVKVLLKNGADMNIAGGWFGTALQAAAFRGFDNIAKLLLENGAKVNIVGGICGTALEAAALSGSENIAKLLLENGADMNIPGGWFGTALQAAAYRGSENIAKLLLENGADVNIVGGEFQTALQAAACRGSENIAKLLLENGANVNIVGGKYGTALHAAAFRGSDDIAKLLLENGAKVNIVGGIFGTTLEAAAFRGSDDIAKLLLENGAKVNIVGGICGTALGAAFESHVAHKGERLQTIELLLNAGADATVLNEEQVAKLERWRQERTAAGPNWGKDINSSSESESDLESFSSSKHRRQYHRQIAEKYHL